MTNVFENIATFILVSYVFVICLLYSLNNLKLMIYSNSC